VVNFWKISKFAYWLVIMSSLYGVLTMLEQRDASPLQNNIAVLKLQ
jgi:hypothetical protein